MDYNSLSKKAQEDLDKWEKSFGVLGGNQNWTTSNCVISRDCFVFSMDSYIVYDGNGTKSSSIRLYYEGEFYSRKYPPYRQSKGQNCSANRIVKMLEVVSEVTTSTSIVIRYLSGDGNVWEVDFMLDSLRWGDDKKMG